MKDVLILQINLLKLVWELKDQLLIQIINYKDKVLTQKRIKAKVLAENKINLLIYKVQKFTPQIDCFIVNQYIKFSQIFDM